MEASLRTGFFISLLICLCAAPVTIARESGLRLDKVKDVWPFESFAGHGQCLLVVDNHTYLNGICNIRLSQADIGSSDLLVSDTRYSAVVRIGLDEGKGFWSGAFHEDRLSYYLGALKRDGDCWVNSSTKLCAFGRARSVMGKCFLVVKDRTYISGACPIEIYKPFGNFYLSSLKGVAPRYSASMKVYDLTGDGGWNGATAKATASDSLGTFKRMGACWVNATAKICAVN